MEVQFGKENVFTVGELFKDIRPAIFAQTLKGKTLSITDRMLQQNYVDVLLVSTDKMLEKITKKSLFQTSLNNLPQICDLGLNRDDADLDHVLENGINPSANLRNIYVSAMSRTSEVAAAKRGELLQILALLESNKNRGDEATKGHYMDLILRIRQSLQTK